MPDFPNSHIQQALSQYALKNPAVTPIRHNENITCRADDNGHTYVLRIRRPIAGASFHLLYSGYKPAELMCGELDLLLHLARSAPFPLQTPVPTKNGQKICVLSDNTPACLLTWINGEPLTQSISLENVRGSCTGLPMASPEFDHPIPRISFKELRLSFCALKFPIHKSKFA